MRIMRTHLTTLHQFTRTTGLGNTGSLLRRYSEKKAPPPKEQHKKAVQKFEQECDVCERFKPCERCSEAVSQTEMEKNVPGCAPFTENVPMPRPQPQLTEECVSPDCPVDCNRSKRKGPPRCPRRVKVPEPEECKTTRHCEDKKDFAKKTEE